MPKKSSARRRPKIDDREAYHIGQSEGISKFGGGLPPNPDVVFRELANSFGCKVHRFGDFGKEFQVACSPAKKARLEAAVEGFIDGAEGRFKSYKESLRETLKRKVFPE